MRPSRDSAGIPVSTVLSLCLFLAATTSSRALSTPQAREAEAARIQLAVFRHLAQDALGHGVPGKYRFKYRLRFRPKQEALRRMDTFDVERNTQQQFSEHYENVDARSIALNPRLLRRLNHAVAALPTGRKGKRPSHPEGEIVFSVGQIRWDGKDRAMVQAGYYYLYYDRSLGDNGGGSAIGWSYRLRKSGGSWRVVGRKGNLTAG